MPLGEHRLPTARAGVIRAVNVSAIGLFWAVLVAFLPQLLLHFTTLRACSDAVHCRCVVAIILLCRYYLRSVFCC